MKFFKPEEFIPAKGRPTKTDSTGTYIPISPFEAADAANAKLEREGTPVWSHWKGDKPRYWGPLENGIFQDTHKALLINIEPIKPDKTIIQTIDKIINLLEEMKK